MCDAVEHRCVLATRHTRLIDGLKKRLVQTAAN